MYIFIFIYIYILYILCICGFKSHSGQLFIVTSKKHSVVNTVGVSSFCYTLNTHLKNSYYQRNCYNHSTYVRIFLKICFLITLITSFMITSWETFISFKQDIYTKSQQEEDFKNERRLSIYFHMILIIMLAFIFSVYLGYPFKVNPFPWI